MSTCCALVHPSAHHRSDPLVAEVLDGHAVAIDAAVVMSTSEQVAQGLLVWFAGTVTALALVAALAVNVDPVDLVAMLAAR